LSEPTHGRGRGYRSLKQRHELERHDTEHEGIERHDKCKKDRQWLQRWERVLDAVSAVPGGEGEALLVDLARAHKDVADDLHWMRAIIGRDTPSAVLLYVDLYIEGVFGHGPHGVDAWHVAREVVPYVEKYPQLKTELKKRYEAVGGGPARAMLEHFFGQVGDGDDLIAMIAKYAAEAQTYDNRMAAAVRAVALRHEPVQENPNTFYIHAALVAPIRKILFRLLDGPPKEAALADSCIVQIDLLRDEYGIASNDTRHPNVMSELPWPPETGPT
jgi:hypothetical protein